MKYFYLLLCSTLLFFYSCDKPVEYSKSIIPEPFRTKVVSGSFQLIASPKVYTDLKDEEKNVILNYFDTYIATTPIDEKTDATIKLLTNDSFDDEAYKLTISEDDISIEARDGRGIFYGIQSFLQLYNSNEDHTIPCMVIEDKPRFEYRGFMLDVSRHFASVEFIKKQLDVMAYFKLNTFHWHLTDGAGWRLEIKKYPELTEKAAWRPIQDYRKWGESGKPFCTKDHPTAYGGYYTQEEVKDIVQYAKERFITVIPEIEMPAHSEEVLAVYPHLSCYGKGGMNSEFCIGNEETFVFLENVLSEVIELFPSEYIHIGGDEAGQDAWRNCKKCQARKAENKLKDEYELQSYLVVRIEKFLNEKGKKLLGWDEILEGGIAPSATIMSWRGEKGGIKAAQSGHNVVMTPGEYCYFDSYQDAPPTQPDAMSGYLPLNKVYGYNPIPDILKEDSIYILGVQANLWREWIVTDEHTEMMMYPRLLALAEVAWTYPGNKDLESFRERVIPAISNLRSKGVNAYDIANEVGERKESFEDVNHLALNKPVSYTNKYHESYAAMGDKTLTDGKLGTWSYGDKRWQAVLESDFEVVIDLEKVMPIHSIQATFMQQYHAWIWFPTQVDIYVSKDNKDFEFLTTVTHDLSEEITGYHLKDFGWNGNAEARYVKYSAKIVDRAGAWLFTDEIIIR